MIVPAIPTDVQSFIDLVRKPVGLYPEVFFAWMVCEDDKQLESLNADFNPLNIRYTYEDHKPWLSSQPYWMEATGIKQNGVCVYPDLEAGARSTAAFLQQGYYTDIRASVGKSPLVQAQAIQASPWDYEIEPGNGYFNKTEPPGHIISLLTEWGFLDKPNQPPTADLSSQEKIAQAAENVHDAFSAIWTEANVNGKDFLHYHMQTFRAWLVANGVGDWEDDLHTQVIYHTTDRTYTI